jgi:hypothetical protein
VPRSGRSRPGAQASRGGGDHSYRPPRRRCLCSSPVLSLQTYGLVHAVTTRTGYTVGRDVLGNAMGRGCTLAHAIQIEPSPAAGILPAAAEPAGISSYDR